MLTLSVRSTGTWRSRSTPTFVNLPVEIAADQAKQILVPIRARVGDDAIGVALTLPDGTRLEKTLAVGVRMNEPPVADHDFITLAPGAELSVAARSLAGLVPGTSSVAGLGKRRGPARTCRRSCARSTATPTAAPSRSPAAPCRSSTSTTWPSASASAATRRSDERVDKAIAGVLANQSAPAASACGAPGRRRHLARRLCHRLPDPRRARRATRCRRRRSTGARQPAATASPTRATSRTAARTSPTRSTCWPERPRRDRRPSLLRRDEARRLRHPARQGADRRGPGALRRQAARGAGVPRGARPRLQRREPDGWRADYGSTLRDGAAMLTLASETPAPRSTCAACRRRRRAATARRTLHRARRRTPGSLLAAACAHRSDVASRQLAVDGEPSPGRSSAPRADSLSARRSRSPTAATGRSGGRHGARRAGTARAGRRQLLSLERELLHARRQPSRPRAVEAERPLRRGARRDDRPRAGRAPDRRRSAAGRLRDREPAPARERRRGGARLAEPRRRPAHMEFRADRFVAACGSADGRPDAVPRSPTSSAPSRRAPSCTRRRRSRTCTGRSGGRAPTPARSRSWARCGSATSRLRLPSAAQTPARLRGARARGCDMVPLQRHIRTASAGPLPPQGKRPRSRRLRPRRQPCRLVSACLIAPRRRSPEDRRRHVALPSLAPETGRMVVDRNGVLLRPFAIADGRWRLPVTLADVDPLFIEDAGRLRGPRFREPPRRRLQALVPRRLAVVAQRPARLRRLDAHHAGGAAARRRDRRAPSAASSARSLTALALEQRLSKDEILDLYLTLAPYGGNIEGIRAASLAYLGKEPRRLTPAEAALLVALPQAPEARRPDRNPARPMPRATACSTARRRPASTPPRTPTVATVRGDARRAPRLPDARRRTPRSAPSRQRPTAPLASAHHRREFPGAA